MSPEIEMVYGMCNKKEDKHRNGGNQRNVKQEQEHITMSR